MSVTWPTGVQSILSKLLCALVQCMIYVKQKKKNRIFITFQILLYTHAGSYKENEATAGTPSVPPQGGGAASSSWRMRLRNGQAPLLSSSSSPDSNLSHSLGERNFHPGAHLCADETQRWPPVGPSGHRDHSLFHMCLKTGNRHISTLKGLVPQPIKEHKHRCLVRKLFGTAALEWENIWLIFHVPPVRKLVSPWDQETLLRDYLDAPVFTL